MLTHIRPVRRTRQGRQPWSSLHGEEQEGLLQKLERLGHIVCYERTICIHVGKAGHEELSRWRGSAGSIWKERLLQVWKGV